MIKALIIDDEEGCRETIRILVSNNIANVYIHGTALNEADAIDLLESHGNEVDIIFICTDVPDVDAFALTERVAAVSPRFVFTAKDQHSLLPALRSGALDYLQKPLKIDEVDNAIRRLQHKILVSKIYQQTSSGHKLEKLGVPTLTDIVFIDLHRIIYVESYKNYSTLYLDDGHQSTSSKNLGYYEDLLSGHGFCRIHNSYLVNVSKVRKFTKGKPGSLELDNGKTLEVSPKKKEQLFSYFSLD